LSEAKKFIAQADFNKICAHKTTFL